MANLVSELGPARASVAAIGVSVGVGTGANAGAGAAGVGAGAEVGESFDVWLRMAADVGDGMALEGVLGAGFRGSRLVFAPLSMYCSMSSSNPNSRFISALELADTTYRAGEIIGIKVTSPNLRSGPLRPRAGKITFRMVRVSAMAWTTFRRTGLKRMPWVISLSR